jgi:CheY-like chemotaxis protein
MARILAIEPDPDRTVILQRLVSERLDAEVVVASSADDAISVLSERQPDLILTSTLLSLDEDQQLATHLRSAPALDHLPVLTIPPFTEPDVKQDGLISRLFRRRHTTEPAYDLGAVASRIRDAIDQSRADAARFNDSWRPARVLLLERPSERAVEDTLSLLRTLDAELERYCGLAPHKERATRWEHFELPWLESIRLTWGAELRLLNMSSSGLLIESGIRMTLGNRTDFQLEDRDYRDFVIPGRVVRSDVSSVNSLGVKYVTAAVFEKPFELIGPDGSLPPQFAYDRRRGRQAHY